MPQTRRAWLFTQLNQLRTLRSLVYLMGYRLGYFELGPMGAEGDFCQMHAVRLTRRRLIIRSWSAPRARQTSRGFRRTIATRIRNNSKACIMVSDAVRQARRFRLPVCLFSTAKSCRLEQAIRSRQPKNKRFFVVTL